MYYRTDCETVIGNAAVASDGKRIVGLWLEGQKYFADTVKEEMIIKDDLPVLVQARKWLERYFAGGKPAVSELPLAPFGTPFRQEVWQMLCEIPYGHVVTYGELAKKLAKKRGICSMPAQAVGGAVGHNPISIIIPCHRVIGSDGSLTGYAGGIEKKRKLLELEGVMPNVSHNGSCPCRKGIAGIPAERFRV
ncbi:MAG: methylated-DNA--[protein]-cysteine S-methyltransferase [Candidatus Choladocola sp.]|nr:methylated-DNA--[protein]-cysteine S-methyltransferase [Candidatus Choladocola sp.]